MEFSFNWQRSLEAQFQHDKEYSRLVSRPDVLTTKKSTQESRQYPDGFVFYPDRAEWRADNIQTISRWIRVVRADNIQNSFIGVLVFGC